MKKQILLHVLMLLPVALHAYTACIDGIYYNLSGSKATVTYRDYYTADYSGSVVIPESVTYNGKTYKVTKIDWHTFDGCSNLTSVTIPNTVTSIGSGAFNGCSSLNSIRIPDSVTFLDVDVFEYCSSLKSATIGNGVTSIGDGTFMECSNLTSVTIGNSVTSIGSYAFSGCRNLTSITIPNNVTCIGDNAFKDCTSLNSIIIPNSVTNLGGCAFNGCGCLTSVTIGNNVTCIDYYAFYGCSSLTSIVIPNSVTNIGEEAFYDCSSLASITLGNNLTRIGNYAFSNCKNLTSITIPNSVTSIENGIFSQCSSLTSVIIGNSVTNIGNSTFYGCSSLSSIIIPDSVTSIGNWAFSGCSSLTSIAIPNSVTNIGDYAFESCSSLKDIYCHAKNVPTTGSNVFSSSTLLLAKLHVLASSINAYKSTAPWSGFKNIVSDNIYVLTYEIDGSEYKSYNISVGQAITPEPSPTKEGYTFSGWSNIPTTMPAHDVTVTGSFTPNKYKLTYLVDGAVYKSYEIDYASTITPEAFPAKEGHTFSGWSEIPATMPAHDVEVSGTFSVNSYLLNYVLDGKNYKTLTVNYGAAITPEIVPSKVGYTFSGWSNLPETMPARDVTVRGQYNINSHTLTYKVDGQVYKSYTLEYHAAITPEPAPTKEGYTFSGWSNIPELMPDNDVVVTGSFTINKYKLTYKVDGSVYKTYTIAYGTVLTPEPAPTKEGHTFSGWTGLPATMPAHDVVVTGSFNANTYRLTYKVDGEVYKTFSVDYGTALTPIAVPTKEGHTFSGWNGLPTTMPAHDVTVTGSFTVNKYKLTYKVDGTIYKTLSVDYGTALTPEAAPTKEGYTFSGWSEIPATMPAHDVTVTGSFLINKYMLTYKVDGTVYKTFSVDFGSALTPIAAPTKEGHTFSGWNGLPATMPAHDVTVTGSFSVNSYTLTYLVDGKLYKTYSVTYGTALTPEAKPTKEGYTFSGWSGMPTTMPAHDVTVTGSFIVNKYKLTYKVDGKAYKTFSVDYGSALTPIAAPTKEGHTFSGWSGLPATMPAHDVTVTGSFSVNSYTLAYIVEGKLYKTYSVTYGTALTSESAPTRKGMTFSGWANMPETMPAYDLTLSGTYSWSQKTVDGVVYQVADTIDNYVSAIGYDVISGETVILPTIEISGENYNVNDISSSAFRYCTTLVGITIPNSVTSIGSYAFSDCTGLTSVTIGNSVTSIGTSAFAGTNIKKTIWLTNTPPSGYTNASGVINYVSNEKYSFQNKVVYPYLSSMFEVEGIRYVPVSPSERTCDAIDCIYDERVANLSIPSAVSYKGIAMTVKNVKPYLCYGYNYIETLRCENKGNVSEYAFSRCEGITSLSLGDDVSSIGNYAFSGCSSLLTITIPKSVKAIGDYVFNGCTGLGTVLMDDGNIELNLGSNGSSPLFAGCPLDSVYIGRNITYSITSSKGYSPFYRNTSLRSVHISDAETEITSNEFFGCTKLKNVRLGEGIARIGDRAFSDCTAMTMLVCKAATPPICGLHALDDINKWECTLLVPYMSLASYQAADQWKEFFFMDVDPDGIKDIEHSPLNIEHSAEEWYDISGRKIVNGKSSNGQLPRGINIIRMSDGTTKKMMVK